ncbi:MAG: LysR family transcriptional regulator [Variibacter sp.]
MAAVLPTLSTADLKLLRVFVAVVHSGGFSAARTELNVSQPTISVKISDLESRLGMRLCDRGRGGFKLTAEGQRVYEASLNLFRSLDTFRMEVDAVRGRLSGDLHVGVADATITNTQLKLNEAFARFKQKAPGVHLYLHIASALELELGLVENKLHAAIGPLQRRRPELTYTPILTEEQVLYCGRDHRFFRRAPNAIDPAELSQAEFVHRGYLAQWRAPLDTRFTPTATTFHMEAATRLILSGTHIGYLPVHHANAWVLTKELKPILPKLLTYGSQFFLAHRRSVGHAALRGFLKDFRSAQGC